MRAYNREQAMTALGKANTVRTARATLKRALKMGNADYYEVISGGSLEFEATVKEMRVEKLLTAIPGIGPVAVAEVCAELEILPTLQMMGLSWDQRKRVAEIVRLALDGSPRPEDLRVGAGPS